ncbi:MAG: flagellar type III secretion system pore protein FliP [Rhodospirillales bacterium]
MTSETKVLKPRQTSLKKALKPILVLSIAGTASGLLFLISDPAYAQSLAIDLGGGGGEATGRLIQIIALVTVLSLAPSILIMMTSFIRFMVVLSFLCSALGTQQTPPNQVLMGLALFLTLFVMMPTFQQAYDEGIAPLIAEDIDEATAFNRTLKPFHSFMMKHVREQDLNLFAGISGLPEAEIQAENMPFRILIPSFMISELRRAFEIGFLVFIPFLIIDMVVASVLMAMGMMMLPPIIISLPFKVIFFVLVDGWFLIVGSLVRSFGA